MTKSQSIVLLAALVVAGFALVPAREVAVAPLRRVAATSVVERQSETPPLPPGAFVSGAAERVEAGIRLPDGTFLPPLNGVTVNDPIPAVQRDPDLPPLGPVVGTFVDATGCAWWVTEDGSAFTTRWVVVESPGQGLRKMVRLDQADRVPPGFGVPQ